MPKFYYDLHIHSILSPCADELMTPNNILNMAMLKELDFIAITDHNSAMQLQVVEELEESYDFVVIPGVEVTVKEEFDVLCYFNNYSKVFKFSNDLEEFLDLDFSVDLQTQILTDIYDNEVNFFNKPLKKTNLPYTKLVELVRFYDGVIVLAHIDRPSQTPLNCFKLEDLTFDAIEIQPSNKDFLQEHPQLNSYPILHNSDAHSIVMMSEKEHFVELKEKTIDAFFEYLRGTND